MNLKIAAALLVGLMTAQVYAKKTTTVVTQDKNGSQAYEADNTGKNKRDTDAHQVTADDQSDSKNAVELTRSIRESIMNEKDLSISAHNVKIIVAQNAVTLKGPVKTMHEKDVIVAKARALAPRMNIVNQLEVITK